MDDNVTEITTSGEAPLVGERTSKRKTIITHDRLTVRLQVHHEHYGDAPHPEESNWNEFLNNVEQPWPRRMKVEEGKPLTFQDLGVWTNVDPSLWSLVVIENQVGLKQIGKPSDEQVNAWAKQILKVNNDILVRPGRKFIFELEDVSSIQISSLNGVIPFYICLIVG